MSNCFHGVPRDCPWCAIIQAQALRTLRIPIPEKTWIGEVWDALKSWILFWRPKGGLTLDEALVQEAQRVALHDGLLKEDDIETGYELDSRQTP